MSGAATPPGPGSARGGEGGPVGWLPREAAEIFGEGAQAAESYALLTVDVPAARWLPALQAARDDLGCTFFDWLSAVDEPGTGLSVCAHLVALPPTGGGTPRRLMLRTTVPHQAPELPSATGLYAGAAWHERETHEMFGVVFFGHPDLSPLLLPEGFEGHPLRKDFVLAARVAKTWPGAKEPGEPGHGGPRRRQALPPGVPDPNEWGPLRGTLPPAPSRAGRARAAGGPTGRRPRRHRSASAGSASQRAAAAARRTEERRPEQPGRRGAADAPWRVGPPPAEDDPARRPDAGRTDDAAPDAGRTDDAGPGGDRPEGGEAR